MVNTPAITCTESTKKTTKRRLKIHAVLGIPSINWQSPLLSEWDDQPSCKERIFLDHHMRATAIWEHDT